MKSIYNAVFAYFWQIYHVLWCKFVNLPTFCCVTEMNMMTPRQTPNKK